MERTIAAARRKMERPYGVDAKVYVIVGRQLTLPLLSPRVIQIGLHRFNGSHWYLLRLCPMLHHALTLLGILTTHYPSSLLAVLNLIFYFSVRPYCQRYIFVCSPNWLEQDTFHLVSYGSVSILTHVHSSNDALSCLLVPSRPSCFVCFVQSVHLLSIGYGPRISQASQLCNVDSGIDHQFLGLPKFLVTPLSLCTWFFISIFVSLRYKLTPLLSWFFLSLWAIILSDTITLRSLNSKGVAIFPHGKSYAL